MTQEELQGKKRRWELGATFTQMDIKELLDEIEYLQKESRRLQAGSENWTRIAFSWQCEAFAKRNESGRYRKALESVLEYQDDFYDHDNRIIKDLKPYADLIHSLFKTVSDALKGDETA